MQSGHLFFLIKRPLIDFFGSILFVVFVLAISFDSEFGFIGIVDKIETKVEVDQEIIDIVKGKKIMVLGNKPQIYEYGTLATPFYNWPLATEVINDLSYYGNLCVCVKTRVQF